MKFIVEKPLLKIQRIWIIIAWINRFLITEKKNKGDFNESERRN